MKKKILIDVEQAILPVCEDEKVILFDLEYVKEGPFYYLRIFIDQENGISIDDCQRVSEKISKVLDEKDIISENYFLEVSSPGIDRPFKTESDFEKHIDESVELKLYQSVNNMKHFEAILLEFNNESIKVQYDKKTCFEIERKNIVRINKAVKF